LTGCCRGQASNPAATGSPALEMLGGGAEAALAKKRTLLRITLLGPARGGKTSLVNALVNNAFHERYQPTEDTTLSYVSVSAQEEDALPSAPKFNALVEIEDTRASDKMELAECHNLTDPWWPRPEALAMEKPPRASIVPETGRRCSAFLPFSMTDAPTGKFNDEGSRVVRCETGMWVGKYFCYIREKQCGPKELDGAGRQCKSCRRFQRSLTAKGEYRLIARQRMAYVFVFDATDKSSYLQCLTCLKEHFQESSKRTEIKTKPLVYLVGSQIDKDPDRSVFHDVVAHMRGFVTEQAEQGNRVSAQLVSAMTNRCVPKLLRTIVMDLKGMEPLWKVIPHGEGAGEEATKQDCAVQ